MSKNLFEDEKAVAEYNIFVEDIDKLFKTYDYFLSRFLESEVEFAKTHSKKSKNKVMCYREIINKIIEAKDLLLKEKPKNDWGRTWLLCKLYHGK